MLIKNYTSIKTWFSILLIAFTFQACGQKSEAKRTVIAFYNIENLFDTIDDPKKDDAQFLPEGFYGWNSERYAAKLSNMAKVIAAIGSEVCTDGPAIIGLAEVENRAVLDDLLQTPPLDKSGYQIVHYDSPDERGIDVALLYKPGAFKVINSTSTRLLIPGEPDFFTRDQLVVTGELDGDLINVMVNHWPSRYSGPEYRKAAARLSLHLSDSLNRVQKNAKTFIMGDLNDDPADSSVFVVLGAKGLKDEVKKQGLFNPMWQIHHNGLGSLEYRGNWNLFDQIIISEALLSNKGKGWKFEKAAIYNVGFLKEQTGKYAGSPWRTFVGKKYLGGFSDHLPVYMILGKKN
ncbi:MAG: endonuclease/exonuclease/phosphatase family protein [Lentimicrobium sp.]|jgi:hypothetical protein|nr:endonuclease/exonuclease/phosphatase family protein [Lentimicrobium sp.]